MASAHGLFLIKDLNISTTSTGLYTSTGGQLVTAATSLSKLLSGQTPVPSVKAECLIIATNSSLLPV